MTVIVFILFICTYSIPNFFCTQISKGHKEKFIHSTRSTAASAAANTGITSSDILKAADWSSKVFTKFYYKPLRSGAFGEAVLSNIGN